VIYDFADWKQDHIPFAFLCYDFQVAYREGPRENAAQEMTVGPRRIVSVYSSMHCLCCLVVRVLAADPEVPDSIPGAARFSE
jgi:hypothetical protein